jgi:hypothetical protein
VRDGASAQRVRQLREPGSYDPASDFPATVLPATGRTLTPVSLPSRTATRTPRSGHWPTGVAVPRAALERPLAAAVAPARLVPPDAVSRLPELLRPATMASPVRSCRDRCAGAAARPALVAAELNVRLPLMMVTFAGGPSAAGPVPVHPAMTSSPAAPAPGQAACLTPSAVRTHAEVPWYFPRHDPTPLAPWGRHTAPGPPGGSVIVSLR